MKAVPGRKAIVKGTEWIADLLQNGLFQPSYIPGKGQRELGELVCHRKSAHAILEYLLMGRLTRSFQGGVRVEATEFALFGVK